MGSKILSSETAQGPDLMMAALPQSPLYRHTKKGEYANPQSDKSCFNHAWVISSKYATQTVGVL
ncbi:MAG: hypothetical protein ABSA83_15385 [Verrucomicrobiota bacterium]|jgi:hypothetical protein